MTSEIDEAIVTLAGRQRGNIRHLQLLRLGLTPAAIRSRVRSGLLVPVHRGVYALGRPPVEPANRAAAAVLACGERAALGFFAAAADWGFHDHWPDPFDVIAPLTADKKLKRLVNKARVNRDARLTDKQLADIVERNPYHRGAARLRWFIADERSPSRRWRTSYSHGATLSVSPGH